MKEHFIPVEREEQCQITCLVNDRVTTAFRMLSSAISCGFAKSLVERVRPLWDYVLIERFTTPATTTSGIYIPESVRGKHNEGLVMAAGPGKRNKDGNYEPLTLKKGDRVILPDWSANEVKLDGKEYLMLRENDILGVVA